MAELPGWDRGRLAVADPQDVEAARLLIYARARAPEIRRDIAGDIRQLEAQAPGAKRNPTQANAERTRNIEILRQAQKAQAALRATLELDAPDDDEVDG